MKIERTHTGHGTLLILGTLCFLLTGPGAFAQFTAQINNKSGAPLQIQEARCSVGPQGGWQCQATLQVAANSGTTWNAYGLLWTATFEDGGKATVRNWADRSMSFVRTLASPDGNSFKAGELLSGHPVAFGRKSPQGKDLRLIGAEVEIEFAVATSGKPWGNTQSPQYQELTSMRNGYSLAVAELQQIYRTQGAEAVHKALQTQAPQR